MQKVQINSAAFRSAGLESERLRILGILCFFAIFIVEILIRVLVIRTAAGADTRVWWELFLGSLVMGFEYLMLCRVNSALKTGTALPAQFWILTTILESSIPAWAIALMPSHEVAVVYRPLASPAVLVFFIFIIMSTLRLTPWISVLSGGVACISYLGSALYLGWRPPVPGIPAPIVQSSVTLNALTLLLGGVVAGAIAGQIRKHLQAALLETETKAKLDGFQRDLQLARSIQQSLLPQEPPRIAGFDIAGWNQPADDTGGDYFDWESLPDGRLIVSLADVTGHGVGPALLAAACRAYARFSFSIAQTLPSAFEHINRTFGADLTSGRFATFVAAVCCPKCPDVEILSAGHGPLIVYFRSDDHFREIHAHALPLGILPSFQTDPPDHMRLGVGDVVLLATDGFFEWENDTGEEFGVGRVQDAIRTFRDVPPKEMIARLYETAENFSHGAKPQDDLTALIIKRI